MEILDNVNKTLGQDLRNEIKKGSKLSIAAACFSIYAFQELKEQLQDIEQLRFIFTSPTFTAVEKGAKERREFYIPKLNRERNLYGTEFEVRLRNELNQKAIARECADWVREKVKFKTIVTNEIVQPIFNVDATNYMMVPEFTTVALGCEKGNNVSNMVAKDSVANTKQMMDMFEETWNDKKRLQDVTQEVIDSISTVYKENSPEFIYFVTLYNIFHDYLEDTTIDELPNDRTGFKNSEIWKKLYNFQRDAAFGIINKLEKYNGCILADSVGLGKTFTALAVIKYYENRNKTVLVLCPKKLTDNWNTYKDNYVNNPIAKDRLNYDVLYHTDMMRTNGMSNGLDLSRINWGNYDLVVIDESHNFRNGGEEYTDHEIMEDVQVGSEAEKEHKDNRYDFLMKRIIRSGVKTKVLMLSATPVNNRFWDLRNQLALAYEGNQELINDKLNTKVNIDSVFKSAQGVFKKWGELEPEQRTVKKLKEMLDLDFFEVLDAVTIARSRKHIQKYYDTTDIGTFPNRLKPINFQTHLSDLKNVITFKEIFKELMALNLQIYTPTTFIHSSKMGKYAVIYDDERINKGFTQQARELGLQKLMAINILKRLESSVYAFRITLTKIKNYIEDTIDKINKFEYQKKNNHSLSGMTLDVFAVTKESDITDETEDYTFGSKVKINLADMDYISWRIALEEDREILALLISMIEDITPELDAKLNSLLDYLTKKVSNPINGGNKKVLVFTAFADTANYLYENVSKYMMKKHQLNTAIITGSINGRSTVKDLNCDYNTVLTCFSPKSKERDLLMPDRKVDIDILIGTDCISEGQNLQDCDCVVNYDIHWNPVRIIQRFGRIDRIGSKNKDIQLVNFWPNIELNEYIKLKERVEQRMKIVHMTGAGTGNLLGNELEQTEDMDYRLAQLQKLQDEVVDLEDMNTGISIVDLGLNEFRADVIEYIKNHPNLENAPMGLSAVAPAKDDAPAGVIYILRNLKNSVNIDNQNQLHPYYMVYIGMDGQVVCNHLHPKELLDKMRLLCRGEHEPIAKLFKPFNKETRDGKQMDTYSDLLGQAIASIINVKAESDMDAFFNGGDISFVSGEIKGLDDFELISFLVVR